MRIKKNLDLGLLLIRLALAAVFIYAGAMKFSDIPATATFFAQVGLSETMVYIVSAMELLGGLGMLFGAFVEVSGTLIVLVMLGVFYFAVFPNYKDFGTSASYQVTLLLAALGIIFTGAGKYIAFKKLK